MRKFTLKKMGLALMLAAGSVAQSQNLFNEPFNSTLGGTSAANGSNGNWVWTNSCGHSALSGHTGPGSALFQGSGCVYGNGSNAVYGELTLPSITVPALGAVLSFNYYLENECGNGGTTCFYDYINVEVSSNGGSSYSSIMSSNNGPLTNGTTWRTATYTLTGNQTVLIRFVFNSIDGFGNNNDGAYVDDINIDGIQPCNGTPGSNTITATAFSVCPGVGTVTMGLANAYSTAGMTYTWQSSTLSAVGPFANITGANNGSYITNTLTSQIWYQAVITCTNSMLNFTTAVVNVTVAPTTTNTVPYFEGFESPHSWNNELPNCSWNRTNITNCKTSTVSTWANRMPRTGDGFANFDYGGSGTSNTYDFYSNGIMMYPGITYSASVWYISPGYSAWSKFSLKYGPAQSQTGIIPLSAVTNPANNTYSSLSATFQVTTAGLYFMNMSATDNFGYSYFTFDDLEVIAPCTFTNNAANMLVNAPSSICFGQQAPLIASGANTYSWNTGPTTASISPSPSLTTTYYVTGTNTLTTCQSQKAVPVIVNPVPSIQIYAPETVVCDGESVNLFVSGSATSFTWTDGTTSTNTPMYVVTPSATTTYSVIGGNQFGCKAYANQVVTFNALPTVTVSGNTSICLGEPGTLSAGGANTYVWSSNNFYSPGATVSPYPLLGNTVYTIKGTDANECQASTTVTMSVFACTGIANISGSINGLQVYPNPTSGEFTVELSNGAGKSIQVIDVTGRTVISENSTDDHIQVNISSLANGVYYVKVKSNNATEVIKLVKQQ